jgi:hypothetical protein
LAMAPLCVAWVGERPAKMACFAAGHWPLCCKLCICPGVSWSSD